MKRKSAEKYTPARKYAVLTPGQTVKRVRELQGMSQVVLAEASGITQPILSAIEHGREKLGTERASRLARALKVHPSVLLFSDWDIAQDAEEVIHKAGKLKKVG